MLRPDEEASSFQHEGETFYYISWKALCVDHYKEILLLPCWLYKYFITYTELYNLSVFFLSKLVMEENDQFLTKLASLFPWLNTGQYFAVSLAIRCGHVTSSSQQTTNHFQACLMISSKELCLFLICPLNA